MLSALFGPRSIAIIGASNDAKEVGHAVLQNLTIIDRIEATLGKARIREKTRIDRTRELVGAELDLRWLLKHVKR
jgi:hypothetical protein